jgi:5-methylcytosine-specific restriction endonuclease McrA
VSAPFRDLRRQIRLRSTSAPSTSKPHLAAAPTDTEPISVDTRLFVWQRDGGACRNCGATTNLHFDHVIPRSWGGASTADNVQLLCRDCNLKKGASLIDGGTSG